jgi:nucleotide-binding universal stress UspA family protein
MTNALETIPKRILVPVEIPELVEPVFALFGKAREAAFEIELLHVWEALPFTPTEATQLGSGHLQSYREVAEARAAQILQAAKLRAESHGLTVHVQLVECGDPAESIVSVAKERNADWIALGSHQRSGLSRWFMGSVADRVVASAEQPVLMVPAV